MKNSFKSINPRLAAAVAAASISVSGYPAQLEEVIVTAQKREQSLQDVPLSVAVLGSEALDRRNINDVVTLTQAAPSLNFTEGFAPSATTINIRGVSSYAIEGGIQPSVSFVVDGVPYGRAGEFIAELADVERIEVLRGPQGTLFGRNSTGGAINIVTKRPGGDFEGSVEASFTDDNEQLYRMSLSGPLNDNVGMSLSGFYKDRDGHIENVFPGAPDLGGLTTWGFRTKVDVDFSDTVNVLFIGDFRDARHSFTPQIPIIPEANLDGLGPNGENLRVLAQGGGDEALGLRLLNDEFLINSAMDDDQALNSFGFSADLTWDISDSLTFKSISSYRDFHEGTTNDVTGSPAMLTTTTGGAMENFGLPFVVTSNIDRSDEEDARNYKNNYFTQEIRLESTGEQLDWIAGFFYTDFEENTTNDLIVYVPFARFFGTDLVSIQSLDNGDELQAYSIFGDITFHVTESLDVFAGVRWSQEEVDIDYDTLFYRVVNDGTLEFDPDSNSVFIPQALAQASVTPVQYTDSEDDGDYSARLGVSWQVNEDINLYASISRGYVGIATKIDRAGDPNEPFLPPVTSEAAELGIKALLFDNSVQLNAAVFAQDVSDLQASSLFPGTIQAIILSAGDLSIRGLEADLLWQATDYIRVSAGLALLDAEIEDLLQPCFTGQTAAQGCNIDAMGNVVMAGGVQQDMDGVQAPSAPDLKYSISLDFDVPLADLPFDGYANISYVWQDDVRFSLLEDPPEIPGRLRLAGYCPGYYRQRGAL